mmetsp:Transcript_10072/g.30769  ORF Transcript_10072/g.30769 Transcript_10072/m.30769 type:complete len:82 (+) Transcript_10072:104-349(+)
MKIYVEPYRERALLCQNLRDSVRKLITTDPKQARIHIGHMSVATFRNAATRLRQYGSRFTNVIAIRPTGWTFTATGAYVLY